MSLFSGVVLVVYGGPGLSPSSPFLLLDLYPSLTLITPSSSSVAVPSSQSHSSSSSLPLLIPSSCTHHSSYRSPNRRCRHRTQRAHSICLPSLSSWLALRMDTSSLGPSVQVGGTCASLCDWLCSLTCLCSVQAIVLVVCSGLMWVKCVGWSHVGNGRRCRERREGKRAW